MKTATFVNTNNIEHGHYEVWNDKGQLVGKYKKIEDLPDGTLVTYEYPIFKGYTKTETKASLLERINKQSLKKEKKKRKEKINIADVEELLKIFER